MNLDFSENQLALDDLVDKLCQRYCTIEHVREAELKSGVCTELWEHMISSGLTGVIVPEEHGGFGFSLLDACTAYEQQGRYLAATPHFSSSIVSALILSGVPSSDIVNNSLEKIVAGDVICPAWLEPNRGFELSDVRLTASKTADGYRLTGEKVHVPYVMLADQFLVLARLETLTSELHVFLVDSKSDGLQIERTSNLAGDAQGRLIFNEVDIPACACITPDHDGETVWNEALNKSIILDAAYAAGLADRALEITVEYAKEREQFGTPIGSFQAISHPLVDNRVAINGAKTLVYEAAWMQGNDLSYRALAMMAASFSKDTAREVTKRAQQVHGGMGFTVEYDIQLYYRRAKQMQVNWYDTRTLETNIAALVFDSDEAWSGPDPFEADSATIAALSHTSIME